MTKEKEEKRPLLISRNSIHYGLFGKGKEKEPEGYTSAAEMTFDLAELIQKIAMYLSVASLFRFRQVDRKIHAAIMAIQADTVLALYCCHPVFQKLNALPREIDSAPSLYIDQTGRKYTFGQLIASLQEHHQIEQKIPKLQSAAATELEVAECLAYCGKTREYFKCLVLFTVLLGAALGAGGGWAYSALFGSYLNISIFLGSVVGQLALTGGTLSVLYGLPPCLTWLSENSQRGAARLTSEMNIDSTVPLGRAIKGTIQEELKEQYVVNDEDIKENSEDDEEKNYSPKAF